MTLAEQFPKATLDGPLAIKHEFNVFNAEGRLVAGCGGHSNNVTDTYSENVDNAKAILHAVSTYDARDEALRQSLAAIRWATVNPTSADEWISALNAVRAKIEAALAVKP